MTIPAHLFHRTCAFLLLSAIAHGLLVFSIGSGLGLYAPPVRTLALLAVKEWHFREPMFVGDTIHVRSRYCLNSVSLQKQQSPVPKR